MNIQVKDWKGNIIKEGDEICFIRVRTGSNLKSTGTYYLGGKEHKYENFVPDPPDEDCWEVQGCTKVWFSKENNELMYTTKSGEYTFHQSLSAIGIFDENDRNIVAIKGVSDFKSYPIVSS